jgi:hypothetical protein
MTRKAETSKLANKQNPPPQKIKSTRIATTNPSRLFQV